MPDTTFPYSIINERIKDGQDNHYIGVNNGLMAGGGVIVKHFECKIMYNAIFEKADDIDGKPVLLSWVSFIIGFHY